MTAIHVTKNQNGRSARYSFGPGIEYEISCEYLEKPKIISIVGITASGKSALGIKLAREFNGEIVSCDSRQVYRGLDIGTAKVTKEEQAMAPHHLLDVVAPGTTFNVFDFQRMAYAAIDDILARGKVPLLVGGSGLYSRSIVEGYCFPDREHCTHDDSRSLSEFPNTTMPECNSPRYQVLQICLVPPREIVEPLVVKRIEERVSAGMIAETERLIEEGISKEWLSSLGLEYYWNIQLINGQIDMAEYRRRLKDKTMQFIKRQRTWFRKERDTVYLAEPKDFFEKSRGLIQNFLKT